MTASSLTSERQWTLLTVSWLVALVSTLGALFFSEVMDLEPCVLCWYQRIAMYPLALLLTVAAVRRDRSAKWYCLPLLVVDEARRVVAAIHAGWRGLSSGVIERCLDAMGDGAKRVWLGPAIGEASYEVGADVRAAFVDHDAGAECIFRPARPGHWNLDLYEAARRRLRACGLGDDRIHGGGYCVRRDEERFFSHRRDGRTGRMAALIWIR